MKTRRRTATIDKLTPPSAAGPAAGLLPTRKWPPGDRGSDLIAAAELGTSQKAMCSFEPNIAPRGKGCRVRRESSPGASVSRTCSVPQLAPNRNEIHLGEIAVGRSTSPTFDPEWPSRQAHALRGLLVCSSRR